MDLRTILLFLSFVNASAAAIPDPSSIPVAILCCCAPDSLRATIVSLSRASGFQKSQLFVFQDAAGKHPAMDEILAGLVVRSDDTTVGGHDGLFLQEHWYRRRHGPEEADTNTHTLIARQYKRVLSTIFDDQRRPVLSHVVLLEEDLIVSRDFLHYFAAVAPVLDSDPSLMLASAWNDHGFEGMVEEFQHNKPSDLFFSPPLPLARATNWSTKAGGGTGVHRADHFPGLGWLCPRKLWVEELRDAWPDMAWDVWLRLPEVRKGRQILVPEVPRTKHMGRQGSSMHLVEFEKWFTATALSTAPAGESGGLGNATLLRAALELNAYRSALVGELRDSIPLTDFWPLYQRQTLERTKSAEVVDIEGDSFATPSKEKPAEVLEAAFSNHAIVQNDQKRRHQRHLELGSAWTRSLRKSADRAFDEDEFELAEVLDQQADDLESVLFHNEAGEEQDARDVSAIVHENDDRKSRKHGETADGSIGADREHDEVAGENSTQLQRNRKEKQLQDLELMLEQAFDTEDADSASELQDIITALEGQLEEDEEARVKELSLTSIEATTTGGPLGPHEGSIGVPQGDSPGALRNRTKDFSEEGLSPPPPLAKRKGQSFVVCYRKGAWRALAQYLGLWPPVPDVPGLPLRGLTFEGVTKIRWTVHFGGMEEVDGTDDGKEDVVGDDGKGNRSSSSTEDDRRFDSQQQDGLRRRKRLTTRKIAMPSLEVVVHTVLLVPSDSELLLSSLDGAESLKTRQCLGESAFDGPLPPPPRSASPRPRDPHVAASLRVRAASAEQGGLSCSQVCAERNLWCAPDFLPGGRSGIVSGAGYSPKFAASIPTLSGVTGGAWLGKSWGVSEDAVAAVDNCPAMVEAFGLNCVGGCHAVKEPQTTNEGAADGLLPALFTNPSNPADTTCLISERTTAVATTAHPRSRSSHTASNLRLDMRQATGEFVGGIEGNNPSFSFDCAQTGMAGMRRLCPCAVASVFTALSSS